MIVMAKKYSIDFSGDIEGLIAFDNLSDYFVLHEKVEDLPKPKYNKITDFLASEITILKKWDKGDDFIVVNVGNATCNLVGYSKEEIVGCRFGEIFKIFSRMGMLDLFRKVDGTDKIFKFKSQIKANGNIKCIREHMIFSDNGFVFNVNQDIKDDEMNELLSKKLFEDDKVGIIEFTKENNPVRVNETITKITGYSRDDLTIDFINDMILKYENEDQSITSFKDCLNKLFKGEIVVNNCDIKFKTKDEKEIWLRLHFKVMVFDEILVQIQAIDITLFKNYLDSILKFNEDLDILGESNNTSIITLSPVDNFIYTPQLLSIFELDEDIDDLDTLINLISKENKLIIVDLLLSLSCENPNFHDIWKIKTVKGNTKYLSIYVKEIYASEYPDLEPCGQNYYFEGKVFPKSDDFVKTIFYIQDVSETVLKEKSLKDLKESLNNQNFEKEILLKEIHHRLKNNLQLLLSFMNIERQYIDDPYTMVESIRTRIQNIALVHEKTYLSHDLLNINFKEFIEDEITNLLASFDAKDIKTDLNIDDNLFLPGDFVTTLSLVDNEIITNTIKYAFEEDSKDKSFFYHAHIIGDNTLEIICGDNGKGLPEDMDIFESSSLGLTIINVLVAQLDGSFELYKCDGTAYIFKFNLDNL